MSLATTPDGFVAVWYDTRHGHGEVYGRRLDALGQPVGPEHRLTAGTADAVEADAVAVKDGFLVGWYERSKDGALAPKLGSWTWDGAARWTTTLAPRGRNTVVRQKAGMVFAAWIVDEGDDRAGVWGGWWRVTGENLIAPRRLADAGRTTWNLNAAIDPAASLGHPRAWVAFDAKAGTKSEELFLVDAEERTQDVVRLTPDDGFASKYPDIGFSGDRAALTWFDAKDGNQEVYLTVGETSAFAAGTLPAPLRITKSSGHSTGAYLAWNGDRLGLAWCDDTPGNQELYFQSFTRDGRPMGEATRVTDTPTVSSIPSIRASGPGFALLWNEYEPPAAGGHAEGGRSQVMFTVLP